MLRPSASPGQGIIVVFARQPRPGQVKTRLMPEFTPRQAADFYSAMLADVLAATAEFSAALGLEAWLAVTPAPACAELARSAPTCFRVAPQRGAGLAERMAWAAAQAGAAGARKIVLRGSDSPLLDGTLVDSAMACLDENDAVLSPDQGGGYGLVGVRKPYAQMFDHAMGTTTVLRDTRARAESLGLRTALLESCFDIDRAADLERLAAAVRGSTPALCERSVAFLEGEGLWGAEKKVVADPQTPC